MTSTEDENSNTDGTDGSRRPDDVDGTNQTESTTHQATPLQQSDTNFLPGAATRRRYLGIVGAMVGSTSMNGIGSAGQSETSHPADPFASVADRDSIPGLREPQTGTGPRSETDKTGTLDAPKTLTELWSQNFTDEIISAPIFSGTDPDTLFSTGFSEEQGSVNIYAITDTDGSISWSIKIDSILGSILALEPEQALYYTDTGTNDMVAADISSGDDLWRTSVNIDTILAPGVFYIGGTSVYLVAGGKVAAYDKTNGTEQWSKTVPRLLYPLVTFDESDTSLMYVESLTNRDPAQSQITAIDRTNGSIEWSNTRSLGPGLNMLADDTLYNAFNPLINTQYDTELVAQDKETGDVKWSESREDGLYWGLAIPVSDTGSGIYATATRSAEAPDTPQSKGITARFDATGSKLWEYDAGGVITGLARGTDSVYITGETGRVASVNDDPTSADFGKEEWSRNLGASNQESPLWKSGNVLYTGTASSSAAVYALDATDGSTLDEFSLGTKVTGGLIVSNNNIWAVGRSPDDGSIGDSTMYKLGDGGDDPWYAAYTNQNGVVDTSGLDSGITDLRDGSLSVTRLRALMDSWESGQPIDS